MNQKIAKKLIPWETIKAEWNKNPEYVKEWKKVEPEYLLAQQIIEARLKNKMTQTELAKKVGTDQAVISRLESMTARPTLDLIRRVATALNTPIKLIFR